VTVFPVAKHCDGLEGTKFYESYRLQETVELEGGAIDKMAEYQEIGHFSTKFGQIML